MKTHNCYFESPHHYHFGTEEGRYGRYTWRGPLRFRPTNPVRLRALGLLGGKCVKCETTKNLHFHHVDPTTKKYQISQMYKMPWNTILEELKKCVILCGKCHSKHHNP